MEKYLQIVCLIRNLYLEYIKTYNLIIKRPMTQLNYRHMIWILISSWKIWKQPIHPWKMLNALSHLGKKKEVLVDQLCPTLCDPMDCNPQAPVSLELSRQEYWSGLSFPSPGDLPDPGIEPRSPALQVDSLLSEPQGSPVIWEIRIQTKMSYYFTATVCVLGCSVSCATLCDHID